MKKNILLLLLMLFGLQLYLHQSYLFARGSAEFEEGWGGDGSGWDDSSEDDEKEEEMVLKRPMMAKLKEAFNLILDKKRATPSLDVVYNEALETEWDFNDFRTKVEDYLKAIQLDEKKFPKPSGMKPETFLQLLDGKKQAAITMYMELLEVIHKKYETWAELFKPVFIEAQDPDIKNLQNQLKAKKRKMIQLTSLDQNKPDMEKQYGLKCGFFVLYNFLRIAELLKEGPSKVVSGKVIGSKEHFKGWMEHQEKLLIQGIEEKKVSGEYIRVKPKTTAATVDEADELSADHMHYLLSLKETRGDINQNEIVIFSHELIDAGIKSAKNLFDDATYWGGDAGDDVYAKIRRFRRTGQQIFMVVLRKGHWIPVVMTKFGMLTANSYGNAILTNDFYLQKIYDFFLIGDVGQDDFPLAKSLEDLRSRLNGLAAKLKNLLSS